MASQSYTHANIISLAFQIREILFAVLIKEFSTKAGRAAAAKVAHFLLPLS